MHNASLLPSRLRWALGLLAALLFAVWAYHFGTGLPPLLMALGGAVLGSLVYLFFHWFVSWIGRWLGRVPTAFLVSVVAALGCLVVLKSQGFGWPDQLYYPAGIALIVLITSMVIASSRGKGALTLTGILLPVLLLAGGGYWLLQPGHDPFAEREPAPRTATNLSTLAESGLRSPAAPGEYPVSRFTYGSGNDQKRPEYNAEVRFQTPTVDATRLLPEWKGKKKKWRERYWGFGPTEFPLNARVYWPEGDGPFPLAMIVHGNHSMIDYSDGGYAYLGEGLASRGIITVSVDENFINGHWSGDFMGKEMPTRAWLLLKHLEQWRDWTTDPQHELYGKVDLERILLAGHSRGGEAVSIAATFNRLSAFPDNALETFDFNFGIQGVVSIAPTDYRYHRQVTFANTSYLSIQGSYDADEVSFWGLRPYRRLQFTEADSSRFKAGVYVHRANHGQFNSSWGRHDFGGTAAWLLNTAPLMSGEDQRQVAAVLISAFAEATLKDNPAYLPILQNTQLAGDWLPHNHYLNHFQQSGDRILQDFEEDIDPTQGTNGIRINAHGLRIWREENLATRDGGSQQNNVLILGWDNDDAAAGYSLHLPDSLKIDSTTTHLLLSLAGGQLDELDDLAPDSLKTEREDAIAPLDVIIILTDSAGRERSLRVSDYKAIAPLLPARFMKLKSLSDDMIGEESEIQLETFRLPLAMFSGDDQAFEFGALARITLSFPEKTRGVLIVDEIGVAN